MAGRCSEPGCPRPSKGRGLCRTHYAYRQRHDTLPPLTRLVQELCTIPGCAAPHEARGLCPYHYKRLTRLGDPLAETRRSMSDEDRFWLKVDRQAPDGCWPWTAKKDGPYGRFWLDGRSVGAHRAAYEYAVGPIPDGLTIDHLCRNPVCCNPGHMEVVTLAENLRRTRREACKRGHPFTEANVYIHPQRGSRMCRECMKLRSRASGAVAPRGS